MKEQLLLRLLHRRVSRKSDHGTRVLTIFFLVAVLLGTMLLLLPCSSTEGKSCGLLTAMFTAVSSVCVTGLSLTDTYTQWSSFGQVVLLLLIQVGGLGYMMLVSVCCFLLRRHIGLRERLILQQAMALNEVAGVIRLVRLVIGGTFLIEGIGALILTQRFLRWMSLPGALWYGVFHAVSAYCNAGFDLMGILEPGSSLMYLADDVVANITLILLVVLGGLGFFVWNDLLIHRFRWRRLAVHTRLVLTVSGILLFGGAAGFLVLEWNNAGTLGSCSVGQKCLAALFQSMTCRTAGFYAVDQAALTGSGKLLAILLMLVGGSSGSTAGGIKTVTVALVLLSAVRVLRGRRDTVVFGRKIPQDQINSALCICVLVVALALVGGMAISASNGVGLGAAMYETVSAICTVGLSTGITADLNIGSHILLMIYMFFGRVGIMTISLAFMTRTPPDTAISRPETRVLIG